MTVKELKDYLDSCPDGAEVKIWNSRNFVPAKSIFDATDCDDYYEFVKQYGNCVFIDYVGCRCDITLDY